MKIKNSAVTVHLVIWYGMTQYYYDGRMLVVCVCVCVCVGEGKKMLKETWIEMAHIRWKLYSTSYYIICSLLCNQCQCILTVGCV
jgi:hypothetical protein